MNLHNISDIMNSRLSSREGFGIGFWRIERGSWYRGSNLCLPLVISHSHVNNSEHQFAHLQAAVFVRNTQVLWLNKFQIYAKGIIRKKSFSRYKHFPTWQNQRESLASRNFWCERIIKFMLKPRTIAIKRKGNEMCWKLEEWKNRKVSEISFENC